MCSSFEGEAIEKTKSGRSDPAAYVFRWSAWMLLPGRGARRGRLTAVLRIDEQAVVGQKQKIGEFVARDVRDEPFTRLEA
jgi:hypothetical protein